MIIVGTAIIEEWLNLLNRYVTPAEKLALTVHLMQNKQRPRVTIAKATQAQVDAFIQKAANLIAAQRKADKKITDEAAEAARIKAELEANPPDPEKVRKPKTRRRRKPKKDRPPSKKALEWLEQAAQVVTERRIKAGEQLDFQTAYNTSLYELKQGIFNPDHWVECDRLSEEHLQNVPVTTADTKIRSYAYPDPENIRTLATYGNGSPATAPPRYSGNSMDGAFRDTLMVWQRTTWQYENSFQPGAIEPTFIQIDGTITAYADRRGSAPMLSYIAKTWSVKTDSSRLATIGPPTETPWSFYYRFKIPDVPPPYYAAKETKKAIRTMRQPRHEETDGLLEKAVVLLAPRPMYGRGFNNNVTVTTQFKPEIKLWQIRIDSDGNSKLRYIFLTTTGAAIKTYVTVVSRTYTTNLTMVSMYTTSKQDIVAAKMETYRLGGVALLNPARGETPPKTRAEIIAHMPPALLAYYINTHGTNIPLATITTDTTESGIASGTATVPADNANYFGPRKAADASGLPYPDVGYQMTYLHLLGGMQNAYAEMIYDPETDAWEQLPPMQTVIGPGAGAARDQFLRNRHYDFLIFDQGGAGTFLYDLRYLTPQEPDA